MELISKKKMSTDNDNYDQGYIERCSKHSKLIPIYIYNISFFNIQYVND